MSILRKIRDRAIEATRAFYRHVESVRYRSARNGLTRTSHEIIDDLERRPMDAAQWHLWFRINLARQRRNSAMRRMGLGLPHRAIDLPRWMVGLPTEKTLGKPRREPNGLSWRSLKRAINSGWKSEVESRD